MVEFEQFDCEDDGPGSGICHCLKTEMTDLAGLVVKMAEVVVEMADVVAEMAEVAKVTEMAKVLAV